MAAGSYDLLIEQGATFNKTITYTSIAGTAIDLTNVSVVRAQMRLGSASSSTVLAFTCAVLGTPTNGQISWSMPAATTSTAAAAAWVYDLEVEFTGGEVRRLLQGSVTVTAEVTRPIV